MTALNAAIGFTDTETGRTYKAWLIPEDGLTDGDDRLYVGPIGWRSGRIPLTFSDSEGEPHEDAKHVGNIDNIAREMRDGESWLTGTIDWDTDELALEAKRLVDEDRITGISVHPTEGDGWLICGVPDNPTTESVEALAQEFDLETCERPILAFTEVVVGAATLLMLPAFEDAEVVVAADGTTGLVVPFDSLYDSDGKPWVIELPVTAAADIRKPPEDWFTDPHLDGPTPLTIDDEGRVKGHLALWNTCHRGFADTCITPPSDATNYAEFHDNARVMTDSGKMLGVGCLTFDVSHADVRSSAEAAKRHYDNSGTVGAYVRAGQDEYGVWLAGAERPGLSPDEREMMRRLSLSGDWRPKGGSYFLIAAQAVPVPGFPIRARVASGVQVSLTTVGPANPQPDPLEDASDMALVASVLSSLAESVAYLRSRAEAEDRQRELAEALAILDSGASVNP